MAKTPKSNQHSPDLGGNAKRIVDKKKDNKKKKDESDSDSKSDMSEEKENYINKIQETKYKYGQIFKIIKIII